jgi:hypothetical protein
MTSLFLLDVSVPKASFFSTTRTEYSVSSDKYLAIAKPTTPAPIIVISNSGF